MEEVKALLEALRGNPSALIAFWLATLLVGLVRWVGSQITGRKYVHIGELERVVEGYKEQLADLRRQLAEEKQAHEQTKARETAWIQTSFTLNQTNKVAVGELTAKHTGETPQP